MIEFIIYAGYVLLVCVLFLIVFVAAIVLITLYRNWVGSLKSNLK